MKHKFRLQAWLVAAVLLTVFLVTTVLSVQYASAQEDTPVPAEVPNKAIGMEVTPAFEGYFKYGEWLPLWVELSNSGPDVEVEVQVQVLSANPTLFVARLQLPNGARKRVPLYILPNNYTRQVTVDLKADESLLATRRVEVNPQPTVTYLVGILSPERGPLALISTVEIPGQKRPVQLVNLNPQDLPERFEGLRSLDLIIINRSDTSSLTPGQVRALETWVRQGGRLVLGGGAEAANVISGLKGALFASPTPEPIEVNELPGLEAFLKNEHPIRIPGPFVVARLSPGSGQTLASQNDLILIQEWPLEKGFVNFVALDLTASPFDAWSGSAAFWQKLISPAASFPLNAPPDMSARQQVAGGLVYPLSNLPMLDLPSIQGLAILLGVYILLVGPLNYLLLRRTNRLHLAWVTIPVITLVFSGASFGLGYALRGTDIFINKIAIYRLEPSGRAQVDSYIGLFSPAQRAYEVKLYDAGLVSPLTPYYDPWILPQTSDINLARTVTVVQDNPTVVQGLSVEQWSMQSFISEGMSVEFGPVNASLFLEEGRLKGTITNASKYDLSDAFLVVGTNFEKLGDLPAGASAEVSLDLSNPPQPQFGPSISYAIYQNELSYQSGPPPRIVEVKRAIVENLFERTPSILTARLSGAGSFTPAQTPYFLAWLDEAPPQVEVSGVQPAQQVTAVLVLPLEYRLPASGEVFLPPGMIAGELVVTPQEGGTCGPPGILAVYLARGEAILEFTLPPLIRGLQIKTLHIHLSSDMGEGFVLPSLALYDWGREQWRDLQGIRSGLNLLPFSAKFIGEGGKIRLRLAGEGLNYCYYLSLGAEASR